MNQCIDACIHKSKEIYEQLNKNEVSFGETLGMHRTQLEPIILDYLTQTYFQTFDTFWNTSELQTNSNKSIVFVERRPHKYLEFAIKNFHYYCPDWTIEIHGSKDNEEFVQKIAYPHQDKIKFVEAFDTNCDKKTAIDEYNNYLKSKRFWDNLQSEYILIAQTDSYLIDKLPDSIFDFDFMAGTCNWDKGSPGYGGLSYRKKSAMLKILDVIPSEEIEGEDCYFAEGCIRCNLNYCPSFASLFLESMFSEDVVGTHQWWTYIGNIVDSRVLLENLLTCKIVT